MKKGLVILVVLAFAAPLYADVTFGPAVDNENGTCTIPWSSNALPIVAMGLDVDVTAGDDIAAVGIDSFFDIYMDAAYMDPCNYGYGDGTPIADQDVAGEIVLPQGNFCISMGGLGGDGTGPLNDPCTSGTIVLTADPCEASGNLGLNALRGGVIDENGAQVATNLPITFTITGFVELTECIDSGAASYADWVAFEEPDCWCYQRQCNADYDGLSAGNTFTGIQWVTTTDLTGLVATFNVFEPGGVLQSGPGVLSIDGGNGICADFDHVGAGNTFTGIQRVTTTDLTLLVASFNVFEPGGVLQSGPGVPICPLYPTGDIAFYTN